MFNAWYADGAPLATCDKRATAGTLQLRNHSQLGLGMFAPSGGQVYAGCSWNNCQQSGLISWADRKHVGNNRLPADWLDLYRRTRPPTAQTRPQLGCCKQAQDRSKWRQLVETAMLIEGRATWPVMITMLKHFQNVKDISCSLITTPNTEQ